MAALRKSLGSSGDCPPCSGNTPCGPHLASLTCLSLWKDAAPGSLATAESRG